MKKFLSIFAVFLFFAGCAGAYELTPEERTPEYFAPPEDFIAWEVGTPAVIDEIAAANLILEFDTQGAVRAFPQNAQRMGASAMIYFYDSLYWDEESTELRDLEESDKRCMLREISEEIGLGFVTIDIEGEIQCGSSFNDFMIATVPQLIAAHGADIVLFGPCNERVLWSWMVNDMIYLPAPGMWFEPTPALIADAFSIPVEQNGRIVNDVLLIREIRQNIDARGAGGRIASLPMSMHILLTLAAAEYGIMRANGEVPAEGIDLAALEEIFTRLLLEYTGENLGVTLTQDGNRVLVLPDYLIY